MRQSFSTRTIVVEMLGSSERIKCCKP